MLKRILPHIIAKYEKRKIATQMIVTVTSNDKSTAYRIPLAKTNQNKTASPIIVVKFVRRYTKRQLIIYRSVQKGSSA